jgi:ribosomal protein L34E
MVKGSPEAAQTTQLCVNCHSMRKCARRTFSEQAWTVLILWEEVSVAAVDKPICGDCYNELRDILIDRNDEIEQAMKKSDEVEKIKRKIGVLAS